MTECTLQEAIRRCKDNGGYCKRQGGCFSIDVSEDGVVRYTGDRSPVVFQVSDFSATWIYEQPEQSAFQ